MSLLLILLLGGCPGDAEPEALLGTGSWIWEDLPEDNRIPVIQGPQGGFHLLGSVRVKGLEPGDHNNLEDSSNPTTTFEVLVNGENYTPHSEFVQGIRPAPDDAKPWTHEMVGRFAILDIAADDELDEVEVEFVVTVKDVNGVEVSDRQILTVYAHELNQ